MDSAVVAAAGVLSDHNRDELIEILEHIQERVLWLASLQVHHANHVRPNPDGVKVGGHQASSASLVSIMTALYFHWLCPDDRVSVKPHASPVLHAIHALLGNLPMERLKELRSFRGLQAYPSRTKDPDPVDFSTGSVGLGAAAPIFAALTQAYVQQHFGARKSGRFVSIIGDAELNEGNIWEALSEDKLIGLNNILWIVDLNRQSLDHITSQDQYRKYIGMFEALGWHVILLKYGRKLQEAFKLKGGERLRAEIDRMSPREYHGVQSLDGSALRANLIGSPPDNDIELEQVFAHYPDSELSALICDLGGHDIAGILNALREAEEAMAAQPVVIFAYTIKGWGLPFALDSLNHAAVMSGEQMEELRASLKISPEAEWTGIDPATAAGRYLAQHKQKYAWNKPSSNRAVQSVDIPDSLDIRFRPQISTQQAFGQIMLTLSREPELAKRLVTASPDVAISTHLGGWLNKVGVYSNREKRDYFDLHGVKQPVSWQQSPNGQHIELGIAEINLFLLLGALGLSHEFEGELLLPIGTIYDTFIRRGLGAFNYALYSGAKFILVGTPSGISLSPEGGAHQSLLTPSIGLEMPNLVAYEPTFAHEVEWILLTGLRSLMDRERGQSTYLRLSTRPISQSLLPPSWLEDVDAMAGLRQAVLRGGYRLLDYSSREDYDVSDNVINIFVSGVMVVETLQASEELSREGIYANVIVITSADMIYREYVKYTQSATSTTQSSSSIYLHQLIPPLERRVPLVTLIDGHSHSLAFLGGLLGARMVGLGVHEFGQSGSREALYEYYGIGVEAIKRAAWRAATMI